MILSSLLRACSSDLMAGDEAQVFLSFSPSHTSSHRPHYMDSSAISLHTRSHPTHHYMDSHTHHHPSSPISQLLINHSLTTCFSNHQKAMSSAQRYDEGRQRARGAWRIRSVQCASWRRWVTGLRLRFRRDEGFLACCEAFGRKRGRCHSSKRVPGWLAVCFLAGMLSGSC